MFKVKVGQTVIRSENPLFKFTFEDYTIVADFDLTQFSMPTTIRERLAENWVYHLNIAPVCVTRELLAKRAEEGIILAFQFSDAVSYFNNNAVYYGMLPSTNNSIPPGTHKTCFRKSDRKIWPKQLVAQLSKEGACSCANKLCFKVKFTNRLLTSEKACLTNFPWHKIYFTGGEHIESHTPMWKPSRDCVVCSNCARCAEAISFCPLHLKCKHIKPKKMNIFFELRKSKFKSCKKYRA